MSTAGPLDGTWELVRAEMDGEIAPELLAMKTELELTAGTYIVRFDGHIAGRGSFELGEEDAGQKTMLLHGLEGSNAGCTIPCIYQQVGDRLRICYGLDGGAPKNFGTAAGRSRYLANYRRRVYACATSRGACLSN